MDDGSRGISEPLEGSPWILNCPTWRFGMRVSFQVVPIPHPYTKIEFASESCRSEKNEITNFCIRLVTLGRAGVGKGSCDIDNKYYCTLSLPRVCTVYSPCSGSSLGSTFSVLWTSGYQCYPLLDLLGLSIMLMKLQSREAMTQRGPAR
jgi:hypothetical protein